MSNYLQGNELQTPSYKKVESYYRAVGAGCSQGGTNPEGNTSDFNISDIRDLPSIIAPPGHTDNVTTYGNTCYITLQNPWPIGGSMPSFANVLGSLFTNLASPQSLDLFIRAQSIKINQRSLSQIKQTFDGIYAGVYGEGLATISIVGITKLWSNKNLEGRLAKIAPTNTEQDLLQKVFALISNMKGAVFHYHDGFAARKWGVIPDSISSVKSTSHNNQEVYTVNFKGASFNGRLTHIETMAADLFRLTGPTAKYQTKKII